MIVCLIGPPGVGKTEVAKLLAGLLAAGTVSGGDVARKLAEADDEVRLALSVGERAPPEKMRLLMLDTILGARMTTTGKRSVRHVVVEGYPRYIEQLCDLLTSLVMKIERIQFVSLTCDPRVALQRRLSGNRGRADDVAELAERQHEWQDPEVRRVVDYVRMASPTHLWELDTSNSSVAEIVNEIGLRMRRVVG